MIKLENSEIKSNFYQALKEQAKQKNCSLRQEIIFIIENYFSNQEKLKINPTKEFLKLSGSWIDESLAEEIIEDIRSARTKSNY